MPRPRRFAPAGEIVHAVNRGNDKQTIFAEEADYQCFIDLLDESRAHTSVAIIAYCLMGTHFHLMLRPNADDALWRYMHRVEGGYSRYLRERTGTVGHGHVFKDRYWSKGIRGYLHLLTATAYVEGNPLDAGLVTRAQDWPWSSLQDRQRARPRLVDPTAVSLPSDWAACVNVTRQTAIRALLHRRVWFPRHRR